jgi:ABC-2 type transport system permease protein
VKRPVPDRRWESRDDGMIVGAAVSAAGRLARPLAALGVDPLAFRELLRTRLRLDMRGVPALALGSAAPGAASGKDGFFTFGLALLLAVQWLAGLPAGLLALFKPPPEIWMAAVSATTMGLLGLQLALSYGSLLVDPTDIGVLSSRPVSGRTLFAARLAHVTVYLLLSCASLSFFPMFLGCLGYPFWAVLLLVPLCVLLSALLTLGLVALFYAVALRLVGPSRFQRLVFAVQIALTALLMGGVQVALPLMRHSHVVQVLVDRPELRLLVPPLHFGGLFRVVLGEGGPGDGWLAAAALLLPALALALSVVLAGRHFVAGIAGALAPQAERGVRWPAGWLSALGARLVRSREEHAAFDFALAVSRRDRVFLRQVLPGLIGTGVVGLSLLVPGRMEHGAERVVPYLVPLGIYFLAINAPMILEASRFSEHWAARWLFAAAPVSGPRSLLRGAALALLLGWVAPVVLVAGALIAALAGLATLPDVLAALVFCTLLALFGLPALELRVPFTDAPRPNEYDLRNVGVFLLLSGLVVAAGGAHALLRWLHPLAPLALAVPAVLLVPRALRSLDRLVAVDPDSGRTVRPHAR